jgi:hypothetical protein
MNIPKLKITAFFLVFLFFNCSVKNATLKKGADLEAKGAFKEASELYLKVLNKKSKYPEIVNALKRSVQLYLTDAQNEIALKHQKNDREGVVTSFFQVNSFINQVNKQAVTSEIDPETNAIYNLNLEIYLGDEYEKAKKLLSEQNYTQAALVLTNMNRYSPDYKDTSKLLATAINEPYYLKGIKLFSEKRYIAAYTAWKTIYQNEPNYKDVQLKMQLAIKEHYKEGTLALMQERFDAAATAFHEIIEIDNNYLDVNQLYNEAICEPIYRTAVANLNQKKCRTAFMNFENLLEQSQTYKNAAILQNQALQCAKFPILVEAYTNRNESSIENMLQNAVIESILQTNDPFIEIIKGNNSSKSPFYSRREQNYGTEIKRYVTTNYHQSNIKAVLTIYINQFQIYNNPQREKKLKGIEVMKYTQKNGLDSIVEKEIAYREIEKSITIQVAIMYQLVDAIQGKILVQKTIQKSENQNLIFARTDNNSPFSIYPTRLFMNQLIKDDTNYKYLQQLFQQPDVLDSQPIQNRLLNEIQNQIAKEIIQFNPEK